jgi:S-DNA-T family DNA segregation ATPase FtsK/SpoIIIE
MSLYDQNQPPVGKKSKVIDFEIVKNSRDKEIDRLDAFDSESLNYEVFNDLDEPSEGFTIEEIKPVKLKRNGKTVKAELQDLHEKPDANDRDEVHSTTEKVKPLHIDTMQAHTATPYKKPPYDLLKANTDNGSNAKSQRNQVIEGAKKLEETLGNFGVSAKVINVTRGPSVTRYELQPSAGVKVSRIVSLSDDISLNLAASGVRIEAPIPGKAAIGIEVPNKDVNMVTLREVIESDEFDKHPSRLSFAIGKDISGESIVGDIAKMPHLLIAGATGSGKSVCINSLITSILYKATSDEVKLLMVDPKVVELGVYNGIPHLLIPVVTEPKKAAGALNWAVQEMVNRYKLFAEKSVRDLSGFNELMKKTGEQAPLPQIVIIIDELADLMMVAPNDVEDAICRLAQMARAAGMHLVIATQRPSVNVITGVIKANIPSRISFAVTSQVDSRTILDMGGAEKLLGRGDMLFHPVGKQKPVRIQGANITDAEVEKVVEYVKAQGSAEYNETIIEEINSENAPADNDEGDNDELLPKAIELVVEAGQASVSLIQRKFKVGYARAARIIDQMEARGIVGGYEGSKPRQILISKQEWHELQMTQK